ncbi:bifunctional lysylphosphatidylglycerol flippase/synthetase MprF [Rickettsiales bacterium]|nr:bifunctional lysylphosphatidylglycerol flippase/synthetase MprF [Rickettsiales bacterium]
MGVLLRRIAPFLGLAFFLIAVAIVHHVLKQYSYTDIVAVIKSTPWYLIALGLLFTSFNYFTLTGYDFLALKYVGKSLPKFRVMLASLIGFAVSNNVGHALVSGPSVRYRFYSAWGLSGLDMIKLTVFLSVMYLLGAMTLAVAVFFLFPQTELVNSPIHIVIHAVIYSALAALILYWLAIISIRRPVIIYNVSFSLPSVRMALAQTVISGADLILASLTLYVFLYHQANIPFTTFLVVYLVAQVVGLYSQVPGGLGVFEGIFIYLIGDILPPHNILASLILYRIVYYFIPLMFAGLGILSYELYEKRKEIGENADSISKIINQNIPQIFSLLLLLAGGILLFSGATPTDKDALHWLQNVMPLPVIEFSHLFGSMVGVLLLFIARAVRMRLNSAYFASIALLAFGIIFSLLKGFDWQEAIILSIMLMLMLPTRRFFYRESTLLNAPFTRSWFIFIAIIIFSSVWLGLFSYKHVEYNHDLWWQFTYNDDASRFLRSLFVMALAVSGFAIMRLLRAPQTMIQHPSQDNMDKLLKLALNSDKTQAHLALLGDKQILWGENYSAFLMYGISTKYWVVMGDPVGSIEQQEMLVWRLAEMADRKGVKLAFYQVSRDKLPLYIDMGMILVKLGETALVSLESFGLEGEKRSGLRHTNNKMTKLGLTFEVLDFEQVREHMNELKEISDNWLLNKKTHEKQFSLGFFSEEYVSKAAVAVAKQEGKIIAFANLWVTNSKQEISIDLMRYIDIAPRDVMEWLFIQIMLWGKTQGYKNFDLGMAPLAGLETHALAPLWHKIGHIIFEYGGDLYNFEGLRAYKDKFDPVWEPRYLAIANGFSIPSVLIAITRLIAGGSLKGVFRK